MTIGTLHVESSGSRQDLALSASIDIAASDHAARGLVTKEMRPARILVVNDDPRSRRDLRSALTAQQYVVIEARSYEEALDEIKASSMDLIVFDINAEGTDVLEACRSIRCLSNAPLLILSVRSEENYKVTAFNAGADDYLVKPFGMQELLVRIWALRRRAGGAEQVVSFTGAGLQVSFEGRRVSIHGRSVHLTPKEFELLHLLIASEGKPVSHQILIKSLWGEENWTARERLRVFVNNLRRKIDRDPFGPRFIHTVPLIGYQFEPQSEELLSQRRAKHRIGKPLLASRG